MRNIMFVAIVPILFMSAYNVAYAFVVGPPPIYVSNCSVSNTVAATDEGFTHAYIEDSTDGTNGYGEARAEGWEIGTKVYKVLAPNNSFVSIYADADFSQPFKVTGTGSAEISFDYDGSLSVTGDKSNFDFGEGSSDLWYLVEAYDSFEQFRHVSASYDPDTGDQTYDGTLILTYNFTDEDVGNVFVVTLHLESGLYAGSNAYIGESNVDLMSDFYNSASLTTFSGPIAPVPLPGTVWLLGSGLLGLVVNARVKR